MATTTHDVNLSGISDWQRPVAFVVGLVLIVVGIAGLTGATGLLGMDYLGEELVLGVFGVPFWLGVTAIVAGLIGVLLSFYAGGGTTFDKVAAGLVFPPVLLLAIADWLLAGGVSLATLAGAVIAVGLAAVFVVVWVVLLWGHPLAVVHPVVALFAVADWAIGLTAMTPATSVNLPTLGLLVALAVLVGAIAFEGGTRLT
jgi:hypothetical protein